MEISNWGWGGGCGCRRQCAPKCPQSVYAPAPQMGYNIQHPVMVPDEPYHPVTFHPEYWQFPQGGQQQWAMPGMGMPGMGAY